MSENAPAAATNATPAAVETPATAPVLGSNEPASTPASDWRSGLSESLRQNPVVQKYGSQEEAIKGLINAQGLIGKKGLEAPADDWKPEQWNDFFNKLGRPETPDNYKFTSTMPEGVTRNEAMEKHFAKQMHSYGLTQKQAESMHGDFLNYLQQQGNADKQARQAEEAAGYEKLKAELGDKFEAHSVAAFRTAKEYGGPELAKLLDEKGIGNHPVLVRAFASIGMHMAEDSLRSGRGASTFTMGKDGAVAQISELKLNKDFMDSFQNMRAPGHKEAVKKWNDLHNVAYS